MGDNNSVQQKQLTQSINSRMRLEGVHERQTMDNSFSKVLQRGVAKTAGVVGMIASPFIPEAPAVLSAAVGGMNTATGGYTASASLGSSGSSVTGSVGTGGAMASVGSSGSEVSTMGLGATGGVSGAVAQRAASGDPAAQMMQASYQMQELNQVFNMQYLMLQQKMQGENRQYTALSNVMKSKHDTAKNALSNLK